MNQFRALDGHFVLFNNGLIIEIKVVGRNSHYSEASHFYGMI